MFDPILNLTPSIYEAIIAASLVIGVLAVLALRRKSNQVAGLKDSLKKVAIAGTKAIVSSVIEVAKLDRRATLASARADAMQERAENAERELMEIQADADDHADDVRGSTGNPSAFFFGDSHFADRSDKSDQLRNLFALLDGKGRNGAALDDLIFGRNIRDDLLYGRSGPRVVHGGDFLDGPFTNNRAPGEPKTLDDLAKAFDAEIIDIAVIGQDGKPIEGAEKSALLREFFGFDFGREPGFSRPAFDPVAEGTRLHEAIEHDLASAADDRGAHGTVTGMTGPDESCSTQEPRSYPASSPRAG